MGVNWNPETMERLERAIIEESRVQLRRRGSEFVVIPRRIRSRGGSEELHATTNAGDQLRFTLEEIESFVVLS